ncbi:hypothetical protein [Nocardia bovistercoris]|uniref:PPE domain-containing protein n=1 Tax=Nocardia bovistercoris TaxID=2785916 RepID=A0A931N0S1_9NOCA|nr:hypothetical protein [Nocardia bovistercoris]MBH0777590.1 hypothetical protein [Nocardia bovistercoris]
MGDSPQREEKSYDLDEFKPEHANTDRNTVLGTSSPITTETGQIPWQTYGKELATLVSYRDSIHSESVRSMAETWRGHGTSLGSLAGQFSNEVKSKIVDSWDSDGGRTASAAVQRYAEQLLQLPVVINAVANSLDFSAKFLDTTRNNIPDANGKLVDGTSIVNSDGDYDNADSRAQLQALLKQRANDVMNQIFVPSGKSVDGAMPMFPLPQPVTTGLPDPTGTQRSGPGSPGPGGAGPGGLNTGALSRASFDPRALGAASLSQGNLQAQQAALKNLTEQQQAAQELARQQAEQAAAQQAAQQAQSALQQGLDAAQQGLSSVQDAAQQGLAAAQQAAQEGLSGLGGLGALPTSLAGMGDLPSALKSGKGSGGGGAGGGGAGRGGAGSAALGKDAAQAAASKLFPRASLTGDAAATVARAGLATNGQNGTPGGMGPAGAGAGQGQNKERKRADYLDSTEHLEEALGDAPVVAKPVVER